MNKISNTALLLILATFNCQNLKAQKTSESSTAQSNAHGGVTFELKKQNFSSGGGVISGGIYSVTSSIAQIDAGHNASSSNYQFKGGFLSESNDDLIFKNDFE